MLFYFYRIGLKNVATDKSRSSQVDNKIHSMVASVNPTLYGGGRGTQVLVSGAFQSDLRDPRCWHNTYMIMRIGFMKKISISKFFSILFSFLNTLHTQKDFFALLGKN